MQATSTQLPRQAPGAAGNPPVAPAIVQISRSKGGVPKHALPQAHVTAAGVEGDWQQDRRYHGGPLQALCLFPIEVVSALAREGYPVEPGSLGENLTTRGLDYRDVRIGDVYVAGTEVRFQITKPRGPCTTIQVYGQGIIKRLWGPHVPWGESGFYARVVFPGTIRAGDRLHLVKPGSREPPRFTRKANLEAAEFEP